jgi:hypothetical protein
MKAEEKCPRCVYESGWERLPEPLSMKRLYVKLGSPSRWETVGWICPNCGLVKLDVKLPLKEYKTVKKIV